MDKRPKRRKYKDNPYTLQIDKEKGLYFILFKDSMGISQTIEVTEEVFNIFDKFELEDISIMNEYDNHIEHSEIYENTLEKRTINKSLGIEEIVETKILNKKLKKIINDLPEIQKRRLKLYYFENMTYEEIAKLEGCTKRAVKFSVDIALEKIKEKLQN